MHCKCMATEWQLHSNCSGKAKYCICSGKAKYSMASAWANAWQLHGHCMATAWQLRSESRCGCSGEAKYCMATAWHMHGNFMEFEDVQCILATASFLSPGRHGLHRQQALPKIDRTYAMLSFSFSSCFCLFLVLLHIFCGAPAGGRSRSGLDTKITHRCEHKINMRNKVIHSSSWPVGGH